MFVKEDENYEKEIKRIESEKKDGFQNEIISEEKILQLERLADIVLEYMFENNSQDDE